MSDQTARYPGPRRRALLGGVALVSAALVTVTAPPLAASAEPPLDPAWVVLDPDAKPALDWSVPERYSGSWQAYDASTATYGAFVNPRAWGLNLDACASTAKRRILRYSFVVKQLGTGWSRTISTTGCRLELRDALPSQGYYSVELTLHTDWGTVSGVSLPLSKVVGIRDYLMVSMGDSLASGEGNPDVRGKYDVAVGRSLDIVDVVERRPVVWKDKRCHRSARSGPSLAAKALEDADPKTSVTFVSVACSGAEIKHLVDEPYAGQQPHGSLRMPPQISAVADLFGPTSGRPRKIDALTMSIGVNDLDFGGIVERCATNNNLSVHHNDCVIANGFQNKLAELPAQYSRLARTLNAKLPDVREIYLNNYPTSVFAGGGCGLLGVSGTGIDDGEAGEMQTWGNALNSRIRDSVDNFRGADFRWNLVGDLSAPFYPHSYCSNDTWFTSLEQSVATQGTKDGTAHPNATGHRAYANVLRSAIVLDQVAAPYRTLTVTVTAMKASKRGGADLRADLQMSRYQHDYVGDTHYFSVPRNGAWTAVPTGIGRFTLDVYRKPSSPRHAVELWMGIGHSLGMRHPLADAYGAGTHEVVHPTGSLSFRYTIEVRSPAGRGDGERLGGHPPTL